MKASHILSLIQNDYTTIQVVFDEGGKQYTYKALLKDAIAVDDLIIVPSQYKFGAAVAKVVAVHDTAEIDTSVNYDYKWIIGKVDMTRYNTILEVEQRFEKTIRELHKRQARRQVLDSVVSAFPEGSQERADMELIVNSGQSLEQIERALSNGNITSSTSSTSTGTGTSSGT
jgi:hypothetical protein